MYKAPGKKNNSVVSVFVWNQRVRDSTEKKRFQLWLQFFLVCNSENVSLIPELCASSQDTSDKISQHKYVLKVLQVKISKSPTQLHQIFVSSFICVCANVSVCG